MAIENTIISAQLDVYRDVFVNYGNTPLGIRCNDNITQNIRYEQLLKNLLSFKRHYPSIHDVGAGFCGLYQYLLNNKLNCTYSATEIVPEMVIEAQTKYPEIKILNGDFSEQSNHERYDMVLLSGAFNMPGKVTPELWQEFIYKMLAKMYACCDIGIAFNFLTTYRTFTDSTLYYIDPQEMFNWCMTNLSRFVVLDHAYPLYEATITVYNKDFFKNYYHDPALDKYFRN